MWTYRLINYTPCQTGYSFVDVSVTFVVTTNMDEKLSYNSNWRTSTQDTSTLYPCGDRGFQRPDFAAYRVNLYQNDTYIVVCMINHSYPSLLRSPKSLFLLLRSILLLCSPSPSEMTHPIQVAMESHQIGKGEGEII